MATAKRKDSRGRVLHSGERELRKKKADGSTVSYYSYQYQDGTGKRRSVSASDLATLREKEKELQADFFDGLNTARDAKRITTAQMVDAYLATKINLKASTKANYEYMAEKYIKPSRVGQMKVTAVKRSDIQKWYGELLTSGFKANSLETIHTILHPTFTRAIDDGYIRLNPTQGVMAELKKSELWVKPKRHALTREEQTAFIEFVNSSPIYGHWAQIFAVLLGTGCRIGEVLGLTWDEIDFKENVLEIRQNLVYRCIDGGMVYLMNTPKTEAGAREIPMLDGVKTALREARLERFKNHLEPVEVEGEKYDLVFRNRYGEALNPFVINRAIDRIVRDYNAEETEKAKKEKRQPVLIRDFSVHQLRHTFATRLCENSSNLKAIQAIMGHADISTTMDIYAEATKESRRNTMNELEGKIRIS